MTHAMLEFIRHLNLMGARSMVIGGYAHRNPAATLANIKQALLASLAELRSLGPEELFEDRYRRFRGLGRYQT